MYNLDELQKKWQPVLEHPDLPEISDAHKRATVATLLENQEHAAREDGMVLVGIKRRRSWAKPRLPTPQAEALTRLIRY